MKSKPSSATRCRANIRWCHIYHNTQYSPPSHKIIFPLQSQTAFTIAAGAISDMSKNSMEGMCPYILFHYCQRLLFQISSESSTTSDMSKTSIKEFGYTLLKQPSPLHLPADAFWKLANCCCCCRRDACWLGLFWSLFFWLSGLRISSESGGWLIVALFTVLPLVLPFGPRGDPNLFPLVEDFFVAFSFTELAWLKSLELLLTPWVGGNNTGPLHEERKTDQMDMSMDLKI